MVDSKWHVLHSFRTHHGTQNNQENLINWPKKRWDVVSEVLAFSHAIGMRWTPPRAARQRVPLSSQEK
jgi:hypothetical protein